jgi:hypothetical protein
MTCSESKEPKGSERSSIELSAPGFEAYYPKPPAAQPFTHSCGQIPHAMDCVTGAEPATEKPECEGGCRIYSAPPCRDPAKCSCGGEWWKHGCKHSLPPRRCTCGPDEACGDPCTPSPVDCAHVGSRVIERSDAPEHWTRYLCDDCGAAWSRNWSEGGEKSEEHEPRCQGCGHPEHSGFCRELEMPGSPGDVDECGCLDDREPPLTPEEEEMVSGYEELAEQAAKLPPQPDRRPPYLVAYSVQGHLYEVALPGDATVAALDGRLVITHQLGPVAGICQIAPITSEES